MLTPNKHMNLDNSLLRVSAEILRYLNRHRTMQYNELLLKITSKIGEDASLSFISALNFLFILGKVDYHSKSDSLEYLQHGDLNETQ